LTLTEPYFMFKATFLAQFQD